MSESHHKSAHLLITDKKHSVETRGDPVMMLGALQVGSKRIWDQHDEH